MQNLCLANTRTVTLPNLTGDDVVRRFAIDSDKQIVYLATKNSIFSLGLDSDDLKSIYSTSDQQITIEDICFLSELNHLCLGLSNGDLLSLHFDDDETEENVGVIGTLEECVHELKCSPDQQILAAVTNTKVLLLATSNDYDPISETFLDTADFGEQQFVNVGWGSKATQFHGSLGKQAAQTSTTKTPTRTRSEDDDCRSRIVWRDDGDFFAVSFISSRDDWRSIKIFNKTGQLQATNELSLNGCIEPTLAWKVSGEFIAIAMRFNNGQKLTISFLEKNGLKHGEFVLESTNGIDKQQQVQHLAWNKDSTILAVVVRHEKNSQLQLWSSSNYHWYLKQSFPLSSVTVQALVWDVDMTNKLHLITDNGQYRSMTWSWTSQVSYTNARSLVFLIDGCRLLISDFTHSSIPPPMSSYEIVCPQSILAMAFDDDHDQFVLILSDGSLAVSGTTPGLSEYRTIAHLPSIPSVHYIISSIVPPASPIDNVLNSAHFRLINGIFYFVEDSHLHMYNLAETTNSRFPLDFECLTTAIGSSQTKNLYLQSAQGQVFLFANSEFVSKVHFPRACGHFSVLPNEQFIGLTENYRLYLNTTELAHNCNSYFIHDYTTLVYSTLQHQLAFRLLIDGNQRETLTDINQRRTERGSRIVCTAYADMKLVLQMPRGNLETIYPRPLLLTYICSELLDGPSINYKRAFELMRKHRVNLNFLYDYNPRQFYDAIPTFITNVRNDDDLCLFLSEINNEKNTRDELIKYVLKQETNIESNQTWHPKANLICERFRACLLPATDHINSILTSYVKQSPSNMEGALTFLSEHPTFFDNAIRYLTYFIDIDRLYDIALGTYNFDLVLMISEKTQKDPKEYLPELNELRQIDNEYWRRFKIDCRLKRFKKAIEHGCDYFIEQLQTSSSKNDKFEQFVHILENHRLYKLAVRRFLSKVQPTMAYISDIIRLYGDYLMTKKYYVEAGLVYERGQLYEQASQAFRQGKDVQNALKLLSSENLRQIQQPANNAEQYRILAEQCRNDSLYVESGQIFEMHLDNGEEALVSYLQGHEWSHVIRLFATPALRDRVDLYEHEFLSNFTDFYDDLQRQIRVDFEKFQSYVNRLSIVRTNLFQHIKQLLDAGRDFDADDDESDEEDNHRFDGPGDDRRTRTGADESGSIRTRLTKKSGSVSSSKKSQRRAAQQQEKLVTLKENSKHEDLAIIRELWLLISKFDKLNYDIRHVNKVCYQISTHKSSLDFEQNGELLQMKYAECLTRIEKQLSNIWLSNVEQQSEQNVQTTLIQKKIREKLKKDFDLLSNPYRATPTLISKTSQWKLVLFDSENFV